MPERPCVFLRLIESDGITENVKTWHAGVSARIAVAPGLERVMFEAADPDVFCRSQPGCATRVSGHAYVPVLKLSPFRRIVREPFPQLVMAELGQRPEAWEPILNAAGRGKVTLLYSSRDTEHNNAPALRHFLEAKLPRHTPEALKKRMSNAG
jgi:hypothetical protein